MQVIKYKDFFEEVWDYVPTEIVDDDFWEDNHSLIESVTKEVYEMYKTSLSRTHNVIESLTIKECGDILSIMFKYLVKSISVKY